MSAKTIFVVEDEGIVAADLEERLKSLGYAVAGIAASGEEAVERISVIKPDLVLMDIMLRGEMNGIEAARTIRDRLDIPIIFVTSHTDASTLKGALQAEPLGYILKPFEERELRVTIELSLHRHKSDKKLREMERWLATTLRSIGDGVMATDGAGRITYMNPVAEKLTGWNVTEALGQDLMIVFRARIAGTSQTIPSPVHEAMNHGIVINMTGQVRLYRRDGTELPIDDSAAPIRDERARVTGAVLVFKDATERLRTEAEIRKLNAHLEQCVEMRTSQLVAANKELESFSYSVSHDLRAPLRAINGFSGLLVDQHQAELSEEARRLVGIISGSAQRMGQMIDDFLNLAQVGRRPLRNVTVDMTEMARNALSELEPDTRKASTEILVSALPSVPGDPLLLRQVWANLLSNAIKFSARREHPRVEIGGGVEGSEITYFVRDNGVGFDPQYADRLFGTFQRLHSTEEFEGTGVGLAIVQRIVQRHGGRVWAEAGLDKGATFHFSLPAVAAPVAEDLISPAILPH